MCKVQKLAVIAGLLVLAGCATAPIGPRVTVLPGSTKSFDHFRADDIDCRNYAYQQIGGSSAEQAATDKAVGGAVIGTVIGALAGAAIGGHNSAGVGAGVGLLVGSSAGASASQHSAYGSQRQYDNAYVQCMYAKGHRVPGSSGMVSNSGAPAYSAPLRDYPPPPPRDYPSARDIPPPPPGNPPPPPPGVRPR